MIHQPGTAPTQLGALGPASSTNVSCSARVASIRHDRETGLVRARPSRSVRARALRSSSLTSYLSIPMLVSALTFSAIVGIAALCAGCAARSSLSTPTEPPAAVAQALPPSEAPSASRAAVPEPEADTSMEAQRPAASPSVGPPLKAGPSTSVAASSPHTTQAAKPVQSASGKTKIPPTPAGQSTARDSGVQPLNLSALTLRLRNTSALGVFTKLSLKNEVDDLLDALRAYHHHASTTPLSELRRRYDTLLRDVLAQVQSGDPPLATDIASSREAIWSILSDPQKFSTI